MARRFPKGLAHGHKRSVPGPQKQIGSRQTVSFRCPDWLFQSVIELAEYNSVSRSEVINQAIIGCWEKVAGGADILPDWTMPVGFCKWKAQPKSFATVQATRTKLGDLYVTWNIPQSQAIVKALIAHYNLSDPQES